MSCKFLASSNTIWKKPEKQGGFEGNGVFHLEKNTLPSFLSVKCTGSQRKHPSRTSLGGFRISFVEPFNTKKEKSRCCPSPTSKGQRHKERLHWFSWESSELGLVGDLGELQAPRSRSRSRSLIFLTREIRNLQQSAEVLCLPAGALLCITLHYVLVELPLYTTFTLHSIYHDRFQ